MDDAVLAITKKDRSLDRPNDESTVVAFIDRNLGCMVKDIDRAILKIADGKLATVELSGYFRKCLTILLLENEVKSVSLLHDCRSGFCSIDWLSF